MSSALSLQGIYVPLITPFTENDDLAVADLERLAVESLDAGVAGIVALGTTGEPATLNTHEREIVVDVLAAICTERNVPLIVGCGGNNTRSVVDEARKLSARGDVAALLSVVPYYTRPSASGIVDHFKAIAQASEVPIVLYNIPYRSGVGLGAEALLELADTPNIAGLKQAVGGIDADTLALMASVPPDFNVLCGDDSFLYSLLCVGGTGAIAASAHVLTSAFVRLSNAVHEGNFEKGLKLANVLLPTCRALFAEPSPGIIKGVLRAQGKISCANLRSPMSMASPQSVEACLQTIKEAEATLISN